jgi:S-adenosylmethionine-dependent methyltransferase
MSDLADYIRKYYDRNVENERSRLERHPIERDITWRYLEKYLPPGGKVLDIGAAAGVYTIPLAQRGYTVTAADFSPELIRECEKQVREHGLEDRVTCLVADARDLSQVSDTDFDVVLMMGPLYHLILEEDRKTALKEAFVRMKPGGVIFSSLISRYGIWGDVMSTHPQVIEYQDDINTVLVEGRDPELPAFGLPASDSGFLGHYALVPEIAPLHERCGFRTLVTGGLEPAGIGADEHYKNLTEIQRKLWLNLLFSISVEPAIIGASCHILYVGEKVE